MAGSDFSLRGWVARVVVGGIIGNSLAVGATGVINTVAGTAQAGRFGDGGPAISAGLNAGPERLDIAVDGKGNLYIADVGNHVIRKVDARSGFISTVVGRHSGSFSGDGGLAVLAHLNANPSNRPIFGTAGGVMALGIAADQAGNLYIADTGNNRIRRVDALTQVITTVAGNGTPGLSGDGGLAIHASLNEPFDVEVDAAGHLYIVDTRNHRIRRVDAVTGIITTVAGNSLDETAWGFSGDGGLATAAQMVYPWAVAIDREGNLYIPNDGAHRVRRVDGQTGIITTLAGNGGAGFSGDGGPATAATLMHPRSVAVDGEGNVFIGDYLNQRIRRVERLTGLITTVAGSGVAGFSGDGGPASAASLNYPSGLAWHDGALYIADTRNHRIRQARLTPAILRLEPDLRLASRIAYVSYQGGNSSIYSMSFDGTDQRPLGNNLGDAPAWSPDGSKIAFASARDGNNEIYVMDAEGGNEVRLTHHPANDYAPTWSPDGSQLAFQSDREGNLAVFVINADGSAPTRLTTRPQANEFDASWSPNGSTIAFSSDLDRNFEIYTIALDDVGNQQRLTNHPATDTGPTWSPDGTSIAFQSEGRAPRSIDIYTMDRDGANLRDLSNRPVADAGASWSPEGKRIAFGTAREEGRTEIFAMLRDGSWQTPLTLNEVPDGSPAWEEFRHIGSASLGGSTSRIAKVLNTGNAPLSVQGITVSDGRFAARPTTFLVPPGGSQEVEVSFNPTTAGTIYATLSIESNDPDAPHLALIINGTGSTPIDPPPFTYDEPLPDEDTCLCLPHFMVQDPAQSHYWWARATGDRDLEITLVAEAVNASETGSATIKVFDPANNLVDTATVAHPASGGNSATPIAIFGTSAGDLYRIEVTVAPPPPPPGMPARHYRLKLKGASLLGANSPLQAQAENDEARWQVNVLPGEGLDVLVSPGPEAPATFGTVEARDPSGVLGASVPIGTPVQIPSAVAGMWSVSVLGADHHYIVDKTSGADHGVYVSWMTWGDGRISGTIRRNGLPNTAPVTVEIVEVLRGIVVQTIPGVTSSYSTVKFLAGEYQVRVIPLSPLLAPSPALVVLTCDSQQLADFDIPNRPPLADAGEDQILECEGETVEVTLDGSGSSYPDGDALTYIWTGPHETASGVNPTVTLPAEGSPHTVTLTVADGWGVTSSDEVVVKVADTKPPTISLNGANPLILECPAPYVEPGVVVRDACDPSPILATSGAVDSHTPGTYTITYTATDDAGNSTIVARTVMVRDTTPPTLALNGANPLILECPAPYVEPGVVVEDACDEEPTLGIEGGMDSHTPGEYTITYTATDDAGLTVTASRTVIVRDTTPPIIALNGLQAVVLECPAPFVETASVSDLCDEEPGLVIEGTVDSHTPGEYTITYTATDASGNSATTTRMVIVRDTTPPVVTLNGANPLILTRPASYVEPGAQVTDTCDETPSLVITGSVNASVPGVYTITYTGTDDSNNRTVVTRSVEVLNRAPVCALAAPSIAELWPPNHKMVNISIVNVSDPDGDLVTIRVTGITQDEPINTFGDGNTGPDGAGLGTSEVQVRAERSGTKKVPGNGRVYVISFIATDNFGASCEPHTVRVCVPRDQGQGKKCIDDGQKYNSVTGGLVGPAAKLATAIDGKEIGLGNYPNPFNPATTIVYSLAEVAPVRLTVYNLLGQQVRVLVDEVQGMGGYAVEWDGLDEAGLAVSSGLYFYRLEAGGQALVRKMLLSR